MSQPRNTVGEDHVAFWCVRRVGAQEQLIAEDPAQFFRPPYVDHRGRIGVRIDLDPDWDEIEAIVADAYRLLAPKDSIANLDGVAGTI